jgi:integrase
MSSESENITEMDFEYVDPSKDDVLHDFKERNPEIDKHYGIKRRKYALSKEQREELLQIAFNKNPIHYCVIRTQLETGTRVGEMANLTLDRLHLDDKNPWIKIQKQETTKYYSSWSPKTISGDRDIYISSDLAQALKYCVKNRKTGYVFVSQKKNHFREKSIRDFTNKYANDSKTIGRDIGTHTMRRTFASFQIKTGKDLGALSHDLGHKDVKTTMIYLFEIEEMAEKIKTAEISDKMHDVKHNKELKRKFEEMEARKEKALAKKMKKEKNLKEVKE